MKIFHSEDASRLLQNKYIYLDNDFLSQLFYDEFTLKEALVILSRGILIIDSLTALEFLRDIFLPEQFNKKKLFISKEPFAPASDHTDIYQRLHENSLLLSRIYSHQHQSKGNSIVDLFLAARLMYSQNSILITGNKKDFPPCVFDTLAVLNIEQGGDGSMRSFSVVQFNKSKFETCYSALQKLS